MFSSVDLNLKFIQYENVLRAFSIEMFDVAHIRFSQTVFPVTF